MKKLFLAFILAGLLSGCESVPSPQLIVKVPQVIKPPVQFLQCDVPALPDKFATNKDVASLLNKVYNNNVRCKQNMDSVKQFYNKASGIIH